MNMVLNHFRTYLPVRSDPKLNKMFSWVFLLISIVIIIQSFPLSNILYHNKENPGLTIDIVSDTVQVLLLFLFHVFKYGHQYKHRRKNHILIEDDKKPKTFM